MVIPFSTQMKSQSRKTRFTDPVIARAKQCLVGRLYKFSNPATSVTFFAAAVNSRRVRKLGWTTQLHGGGSLQSTKSIYYEEDQRDHLHKIALVLKYFVNLILCSIFTTFTSHALG